MDADIAVALCIAGAAILSAWMFARRRRRSREAANALLEQQVSERERQYQAAQERRRADEKTPEPSSRDSDMDDYEYVDNAWVKKPAPIRSQSMKKPPEGDTAKIGIIREVGNRFD